MAEPESTNTEQETVTGEVVEEAEAGMHIGAVQMTSIDMEAEDNWTEMFLEEGTYKLVRVDDD